MGSNAAARNPTLKGSPTQGYAERPEQAVQLFEMADQLRFIAGAFSGAEDTGANNGKTLRGFSPPVLRDGFSGANPPNRSTVDRVEVIRGPVSALYGASGPGGLINYVSKRGKRTPIKDTAYECGMLPQGEGSTRLSVKFYLVAMLFILFDIEAIFLYPWAVVYRQLKLFGFVEMLLFIVLVLVGFYYVWKKGALDWSREETSLRHKVK